LPSRKPEKLIDASIETGSGSRADSNTSSPLAADRFQTTFVDGAREAMPTRSRPPA
jgi:hypothetical protein